VRCTQGHGGVGLLSLIIKTTRFLAYHLLLVVEDRFCRLPRRRVQPEVERLPREDLPLKAQVIALVLELNRARRATAGVAPDEGRAGVRLPALTRGDTASQNHYLSASETTLEGWATRLRRGPWPWRKKKLGGRPGLPAVI